MTEYDDDCDDDCDDDYDDYCEPIGSCEWCGTNLYSDDYDGLCDLCAWHAMQDDAGSEDVGGSEDIGGSGTMPVN